MGNTNLWREVVVLGVACILLRTGAKANQPPIITAGMENHQIPEDTLVGTTVYTLDATDADGDTLTYGVGQAYGVSGQVTNLFMVDPSTGVVTLRTQLDREECIKSGGKTVSPTITVQRGLMGPDVDCLLHASHKVEIIGTAGCPIWDQLVDSRVHLRDCPITTVGGGDFGHASGSVVKDDGSLDIKIYRKPTHTDQYLNFGHKLGVIRTLFHRADTIITNPHDREAEKEHITQALLNCGYPKWAVSKATAPKRSTTARNLTLDKVRILDTEQDYFVRGVKEAVYIRAHQPSLNRDGGRYRLPATFDALLTSSRFRLPELFQGIPYEVNVNENDIQQTSIFRVTATDADQGIRGTVSYYLEDGDETKFEVDRPTGVVNLREALDYEESPIHLVWIRAQDGGGSYRGNQVVQNSTTVLIVHVVDEDDEFPLFLGLPCSTHVNEDTPLGTSIITITAEDEDCGICNNTIIYCTADERDRIAISTVVGVAVGTTMLGILVGILATILAQRYCANLYKCPEGHKIGDMGRIRTRNLSGVSRTRYRLRHTTPL
ncbi:hypothetical protein Bbelb_089590 [Branchiostoma belcheri]|nr:hypothetical protein Bbelb_089590 [Branchiostoma belcheri]